MKKHFTLLCLIGLVAGTAIPAQGQDKKEPSGINLSFDKAGDLKISGYLQGQWQMAQEEGSPAFTAGGDFPSKSNNRFMVRRGRIKFTYTYDFVQMVVQPDFTEKGVGIKDVYLNLTSRSKVIGGQLGLFDRPFGYEISYSSSKRESPERSRVYLSLFPGERDLGAMMILRGPKQSWLNDFTLNAGLFSGNGIGKETDSRKDFIGRLAYLHAFDNAEIGAAFSYYNGGIYNPVNERFVYTKNQGYQQVTEVEGKYSKREYFGGAVQYLQKWALGTTNIRAEYLWGTQPGTANKNANPGGDSFGNGTLPLYLRNFRGAYVYLVQDIGKSKHALVLKYDHYDPNTKIKAREIGVQAGTGPADVAYNTYGVGYLFRWNKYLHLMAYYDIVSNEKCANLTSAEPLQDYSRNIKDNILTLRVQVKF